MFAKLGVEYELIDDFILEYKKTYQNIYLDETFLLDGAGEAVEFASCFADVGVVTTKTSKFSQILLEHLGVKFIKVVIGREDVPSPKPSPEPVLRALSVLQKTHQNAFMIGDTKLDAIAASSASIKSIGVICGYSDEAELNKYCDFVVNDASAAVKLVFDLQ